MKVDARLVPAALICWGAVAFGVLAGSSAGQWLALALAVLGCGGLIARRWRSLTAALVLGAALALATAWQVMAVEQHPLAPGATVSVTVVLTSDPEPVTRYPDRVWMRAELDGGGRVTVLAPASGWMGLLPGQRIRVHGSVGEPWRRDLTVAALRVRGAPDLVGVPPWWHRAAGAVRRGLADASQRALGERAAGLTPALVVGDTTRLSDEVREEFRDAGLAHLTAVSGANVSIVVTCALTSLALLAAGPRTRVVLALLAVGLFVVIARPSASVLRAAAMGLIAVTALGLGRASRALPALCATVVVLVAWWPELAVDIGFALSVVATAGLILVVPRYHGRLPQAVVVAVVAYLVTTPIVVAVSGQLSVVAVVANLLVAPVIWLITVVGMLAALVAVAWPAGAAAMLWLAVSAPVWWLLTVAQLAGAVPTVKL